MGIAGSLLPDVGALTIQFTFFGALSSMAIGTYRKHDWWGFLPTYAAIMAYHVLVRTGGDVKNPLNGLTGADYEDARRILYIVYPTLLFFYCWIGFILQKILSNIQLLTLTELIPYPLRSRTVPEMVVMPDGQYSVRNLVEDRNAPDMRFGAVGLTPSLMQNFWTLIWFLGGIAAPQIVYDFFIKQDQLMAFLVILIVQPVSTFLFFAYCRWFHTDPGSFGLTKEYLVANNTVYRLEMDEIEKIDAATKERVAWAILPICGVALLGNVALGAWRFNDQDVDHLWLWAVGLWALLGMILFAVSMVMRPDSNPFVVKRDVRRVDDSNGAVERMLAPTPVTYTEGYSTVSQRKPISGALPVSASMHTHVDVF